MGSKDEKCSSALAPIMRDVFSGVKTLARSRLSGWAVVHALEHLWMFLCKNRENLISHSLRDTASMGYVSWFWSLTADRLH